MRIPPWLSKASPDGIVIILALTAGLMGYIETYDSGTRVLVAAWISCIIFLIGEGIFKLARKRRARRLLMSLLDPVQLIDYKAKRSFKVIFPSKEDHSLYDWAEVDRAQGIIWYNKFGVKYRQCIYPYGFRVCVEDRMIAYLLHLRNHNNVPLSSRRIISYRRLFPLEIDY